MDKKTINKNRNENELKRAKMPVEAKSPTAPLSDANAQTPKKKQTAGKAALAKVTLLDGSTLDVTIDVSIKKSFSYFLIFTIFLIFLNFIFSVKPKAKIY